MEQRKSIDINAPAKINLYLKIKERRPDGYHEIDSLMQKLRLADQLHIQIGNPAGISLSCPDADLPEDESNLAFKAAQIFLKHTGITQGVAITLEKRIPIAAGLGGGSSDAAAVLTGLDRLCDTGLGQNQLVDMARKLGADVPFFMSKLRAAVATGIGDCLEETPGLQGLWIVLVNPGFPVSTKWVYENFALTTDGNPYILGRKRKIEELSQENGLRSRLGLSKIFNDLEPITAKRYPVIDNIKSDLRASGANTALMSGSGPTVFGLFEEQKNAEASCKIFAGRFGDTNVFLTQPLEHT